MSATLASWTPSAARTVAVVPTVPLRGVRVAQLSLMWPAKAAGDSLDFTLDLSAWLADASDVLVPDSLSITITPSGGATDLGVVSSLVAGALVILDLSGGTGGTAYQIAISAETPDSRSGSWSVALPILAGASAIPAAPAAPPIADIGGAIYGMPGVLTLFGAAVTLQAAPMPATLNGALIAPLTFAGSALAAGGSILTL